MQDDVEVEADVNGADLEEEVEGIEKASLSFGVKGKATEELGCP